MHAFRDHVGLQRLTIKEAPYLESVSGIADLSELNGLAVLLAQSLSDVADVSEPRSLAELELQGCDALNRLDDFRTLVGLRFLGFSDCGDVETLMPLAGLRQLEVFHAWGSTRVLDSDLSPLARLPNLREIRMRDRRGYRPQVGELVDQDCLRLTTGPHPRPTS